MWDCCSVWKGAFHESYLRIRIIAFVIGGFVWDVLTAPDPPLPLYFFSVNNIIMCTEVSFNKGFCCRKTGQLTSVGWCLYDTGGRW